MSFMDSFPGVRRMERAKVNGTVRGGAALAKLFNCDRNVEYSGLR